MTEQIKRLEDKIDYLINRVECTLRRLTASEQHVKSNSNTSTSNESQSQLEAFKRRVENWLQNQWNSFRAPLPYARFNRTFIKTLQKHQVEPEQIIDSSKWIISPLVKGGRVIFPKDAQFPQSILDTLQIKPSLYVPESESSKDAMIELIFELSEEGYDMARITDIVKEVGPDRAKAIEAYGPLNPSQPQSEEKPNVFADLEIDQSPKVTIEK